MPKPKKNKEAGTRAQGYNIHNVIGHLNSLGLAVVGPCVDLKSGRRIGDQMYYGAKDVLRFRKLHERNLLTNMDGNDN